MNTNSFVSEPKQHAHPGRNSLKSPSIAIPTLALASVTLTLWTFVIWLAFEGRISPIIACIVNTTLAYVSFTPQHEAVHDSVSRSYPWLNGLIGRLSGLPLFSPFPAFRRLHLAHHKHTNDPDNDPDFWSGQGPWYMLPFRWMTQELRYWVVSATIIKETSKARKRESIITLIILYGAAFVLAMNGHAIAVLWACIIPSRLASALLAYLFDYLPHRPHNVSLKENPFIATRNIKGRTLSFFFLAQNYHLVHHMFPTVPFYRYLRIWKYHRGWFESKVSTGITTPSRT